MQIHFPGVACDVIILNNSVIYVVQEKEIFKQYQTDHNLVKDAREKRRNTIYKVDPKILCSAFHLILQSQKDFPPKWGLHCIK